MLSFCSRSHQAAKLLPLPWEAVRVVELGLGGGEMLVTADALFFPLFGFPLPVTLAAGTATTRLW